MCWGRAGGAGESGMGGGAVVADRRLGFRKGVSPRPSAFPLVKLAVQLYMDSGSSHEEETIISKV